eukprot:CAMPEP_0170552258 /NCGR_PEP_ID=MMETSP0211-20121228/10162_1 /TAXON_ID=311385 /ORGANISM="Pseudokeronopsis sp., Strain OXSARD2" /LENGTH=96 /DNA_ID=CAMNT_0010859857 /DNA_START=340 /DNA_END=630 /DNA_ORIENTATION=-
MREGIILKRISQKSAKIEARKFQPLIFLEYLDLEVFVLYLVDQMVEVFHEPTREGEQEIIGDYESHRGFSSVNQPSQALHVIDVVVGDEDVEVLDV